MRVRKSEFNRWGGSTYIIYSYNHERRINSLGRRRCCGGIKDVRTSLFLAHCYHNLFIPVFLEKLFHLRFIVSIRYGICDYLGKDDKRKHRNFASYDILFVKWFFDPLSSSNRKYRRMRRIYIDNALSNFSSTSNFYFSKLVRRSLRFEPWNKYTNWSAFDYVLYRCASYRHQFFFKDHFSRVRK